MPHFFGYFARSGTGVEMDPKNDASLAAIRGQNVGRPEWWWVGRNFPRISLTSRADHWGLTVPDSRALIADKNASFPGHFRRSGIGVIMAQGNEESLTAIRG